jgi:hypothetical protein
MAQPSKCKLRSLLYAEGSYRGGKRTPSTRSCSSAFFVAACPAVEELWKSHHKSSRYLESCQTALSCMSAKPHPTTLLSSTSKCLPQKSRPDMSYATGVAAKGMCRTWALVELVLLERLTSGRRGYPAVAASPFASRRSSVFCTANSAVAKSSTFLWHSSAGGVRTATTKPQSRLSLKFSPHFQQKVPEQHGIVEKPDSGQIITR